MGDTGGNMAHWAAGLYGGGAQAAEATVVTTTVSSPTSGGSAGSPTRPPGIEGRRVGKPARRRSRASRRAPVTLLNTDTSNFRAMVQQFTGIPSGPYGPAGAGGAGGPVISFGVGGGEYGSGGALPVRPSPTSAVMSFDHHHNRPQPATTSLQGQLFRPQPQHQQYGYDTSGIHGGGGDMSSSSFLHGFESSSAEDRLLLQSIQAAQMMPTSRPASTNNTNGYNFG